MSASLPHVPPTSVPLAMQHAWLSLMRQRWNSMAIVPAAAGIETFTVTAALIEISTVHDLGEFKIFHAQGAAAEEVSRIQREMTEAVARGVRAVVALDAVTERLQGIPLATATDAVLLVVQLGSTELRSARATIEVLGRDRIVGAVTLGASSGSAPRNDRVSELP